MSTLLYTRLIAQHGTDAWIMVKWHCCTMDVGSSCLLGAATDDGTHPARFHHQQCSTSKLRVTRVPLNEEFLFIALILENNWGGGYAVLALAVAGSIDD